MMSVSTQIEDEFHPRLQVREYARFLQSAYGELLEPALPESLSALVGRIQTPSAEGAEKVGDGR
jgi:hypothetical protein